MSHATAGLLSGAPEPATVDASIVAARPRPILLIAGHDERAFTRALAARGLANLRIWQTDAAHTAALASQPASWARHVLGFLDGALGTSGR